MNDPLPYYKSHKTVQAMRIGRIEGCVIFDYHEQLPPLEVEPAYIEKFKHKLYQPGYYVRYQDGYESFCPVDAFEEGYSRLMKKPLPAQAPLPTPRLYIPGTLGGEPMTPAQIASALQSTPGHPATRGVIQVLEVYAHEALSTATTENVILGGEAGKFLMAYSFLSNILSDLQDYMDGKVPDNDRPRPYLKPQPRPSHE